jgi:hypothetical protein
MRCEPEASRKGIDVSETAERSFNPDEPIEVTKAEGGVDNPGTSPPPPHQCGEGEEDAAHTRGR